MTFASTIREIDHGILYFSSFTNIGDIQYIYLKRDVKSHQAERQDPWASYEVHCK